MSERHASLVRPMREGDIPAAVALSGQAFDVSESDEANARFAGRMAHLLRTDPDGAFVAERDGGVIGVALALVREGVWCLSLLTVLPGEQSAGAGSALIERALAYGGPASPGLIISSEDPRAQSLYRRAGFELRPTVQLEGTLDRARLPPPHPEVRAVAAAELEDLAAISRELRGASHTLDLAFALTQGALVLRLADRGLAAVLPDRGVSMLAARDEEAAQALLWHALEAVGEGEQPLVRWITADQPWAVEVARLAGLSVIPYGALAVRGRPGPLRPYLPWGPFG
jgi:predicted N-acetyltransferase YhbS